MTSHLVLQSGGFLDIDHLPNEPTFEMLEACVERIRELEKEVEHARLMPSPSHKRRHSEGSEEQVDPLSLPSLSHKRLHSEVFEQKVNSSGSEEVDSFLVMRKRQRLLAASEPQQKRKPWEMPRLPEGPKPLTASLAKPIVAELKTKLKSAKFFPGSHAEARLLTFTAPRFPSEVAEQLFGPKWDGKLLSRKFEGAVIAEILRLKPGDLKATLYKKPHRFSKRGATPKRWGTAPLDLLSCELTYKRGNLHGRLRCINSTASPPVPNHDVKQHIRLIYEIYNPEKVADVPRLLEKYAGKELQLYRDICIKHGVDPLM